MNKTLVISACSALVCDGRGDAGRAWSGAAARCRAGKRVLRRAGDFSRRLDDRVRQRRRHLGSARAGRRCPAARVPHGHGIASAVFARWKPAGVHLEPHRRRRRLRPLARDREPGATHLRRCERARDRLVAGREVGVLLVEQPRCVGHARRLSRRRRGRHADAGRGGSLYDGVLRRALAGRRHAGDYGARERRIAVVAQGPQPSR